MSEGKDMQGQQEIKGRATAMAAVKSAMNGKSSILVCGNTEGVKRRHDSITEVLSQTAVNYVATSKAFYIENAGQIVLEIA
jgi:hypothetical protein